MAPPAKRPNKIPHDPTRIRNVIRDIHGISGMTCADAVALWIRYTKGLPESELDPCCATQKE